MLRPRFPRRRRRRKQALEWRRRLGHAPPRRRRRRNLPSLVFPFYGSLLVLVFRVDFAVMIAIPEPSEALGAGVRPREEVAATLAALEAGVRQRQGEKAALGGGGGDELGLRLAELRQREFVQEPRPVSPRPGFGRLIVALRKAAYHLFFKWHARAVLQQQNEFNQTASALLGDLAERERESRRQIERLRSRLAELERSPEPPA